MISTVVVFPAPLGPRMENTSPLWTVEIDPVHGSEVPVPLDEIVDGDDIIGHF